MKGDGSLIKEYSVVALQGLTLVLFIFFMWVASRGMKSLKIVGSVAGIAMFVMSLLYVAMAVTAPAITEVHIGDHKHYLGNVHSSYRLYLHYHYFNAGFRGWRSREDFSLR